MQFTETMLGGAYLVELEPRADERGFFARTFCQREFAKRGLNPCVAQCNLSVNQKEGTLRGMHWQAAPYQEAKLVACPKGAIYDVIVDLRPDSPTYLKWESFELSAANRGMLYIPEDFAHGFLTLEDDTEVIYWMSEFYEPQSARGFRWDDPAVGIKWPKGEKIISPKDAEFPDLNLSSPGEDE